MIRFCKCKHPWGSHINPFRQRECVDCNCQWFKEMDNLEYLEYKYEQTK